MDPQTTLAAAKAIGAGIACIGIFSLLIALILLFT
jgi:hypothetical protein